MSHAGTAIEFEVERKRVETYFAMSQALSILLGFIWLWGIGLLPSRIPVFARPAATSTGVALRWLGS